MATFFFVFGTLFGRKEVALLNPFRAAKPTGKLPPCWVIWWAMWGSMEVPGTKNSTPTENFSVEVHFGGTWRAMSDQCWAVLGLCWAHVVSFGGLHGVPWRSLE